jgi:hypothetical protein
MKKFLAKIFAKIIHIQNQKWINNPEKTQKKIFEYLIKKGAKTQFGIEHNFGEIRNYEDFKNKVRIRDYEDFKKYIEQIKEWKKNILRKWLPIYFAKTSWTTSWAKYIPISKESMPYHIKATRNAILNYIYKTKNTDFIDGKMIFLQWSPILEKSWKITTGRLSGIVAHFVPKYLQKNRVPTWETNCIEDREDKVNKIVEETINEDMTVISGIPSWVQWYFEKIVNKTWKKVCEVFPNFNLFIYGWVNYEPYRTKFENLMWKRIDSIELFPASEWFYAYQDQQEDKWMLLLLNWWIFYEFVKKTDWWKKDFKRHTIWEVEKNIDYVLIVSTNAWLWAYNTWDIIQFTSIKPYKIIVSGRIWNDINAFGEHVIAKEVEFALSESIKNTDISVNEFTVAPQVNPENWKPYHEWFVEFEKEPENMDKLAEKIDKLICQQNIYYKDLRNGNNLKNLVIRKLSKWSFDRIMKAQWKYWWQNKIPRLKNDRSIADLL